VKLLLTSGGITNPTLHAALEDLLGKPVAEARALVVPTAEYGHVMCTPESALRFVEGQSRFGWGSVGLLELTALPTMVRERWVAWVEAADVLYADGGDATYLAHWMRASGLADLLPALADTVWVGVSAGSMVMTPRIGTDFIAWAPAGEDDRTLGVVDFSIFPHLGHAMMPDNTMAEAERWAAGIGNPSYAVDDATAIRVVDGEVEVVSEGEWRHFPGS
jgi:dipeptidase E